MKFALVLLGLAVLLFGCVVQPTGPLEESIRPPAGLDVKDAFDDSTPEQVGVEENETMAANESSVNETVAANETIEENETMAANESSVNETVAANETSVTLDSSELAKHSSKSDCWVLYGGEVYDMTKYLLLHPGGTQPIAEHCGKSDNSFGNAFEGEHGMSKVKFLKNLPHMGPYMGQMMGN